MSALAESKLFKLHFKGKNPIRMGRSESEQKEFRNLFAESISGLKHVSMDEGERHYRYDTKKNRDRIVCGFTIKELNNSYRYNDTHSFTLLLNENNELTISSYSYSAPVSDIGEITAFISSCMDEFARNEAKRAKRKKIREFKAQAIIAQVRKLAKEEQFDYATDTDTVKLILFVKLSDTYCVELFIPFNRFEDALPKLREAIVSLRELHRKGIKFKIRMINSYRTGNWISHESL